MSVSIKKSSTGFDRIDNVEVIIEGQSYTILLSKNEKDHSYPIIYNKTPVANKNELLSLIRTEIKNKEQFKMTSLADDADLNPTQLYSILSKKGNPTLDNFLKIIKAMGKTIRIE